MATLTKALIIARIKALFGAIENASNEMSDHVDELFSRQHTYHWPELHYTATKRAALGSEAAQTVSLSASQGLNERTIFMAVKPCTITAVHYFQRVSSTVTVTNTMAWALKINKRRAGITSTSATVSYSNTFFVAGVTSCSTKGGSKSWSWSALTRNTNTLLPNPCLLSRTASKLEMAERDILTAQVAKGSKVTALSSDDSGAIFRGGRIVVYYKES